MTNLNRETTADREKSADGDVLREMIGLAAERLIEVGLLTGRPSAKRATSGWRSPSSF